MYVDVIGMCQLNFICHQFTKIINQLINFLSSCYEVLFSIILYDGECFTNRFMLFRCSIFTSVTAVGNL